MYLLSLKTHSAFAMTTKYSNMLLISQSHLTFAFNVLDFKLPVNQKKSCIMFFINELELFSDYMKSVGLTDPD